MLKSIRYCLANMFNPRGRNGRRTYWHYLGFVFFLNLVVMAIAAVPALSTIVAEISQNSASRDPASLEGDILEQMIAAGLPSKLVMVSLCLGALNIVLFTACFVRRSHDAGLPGMVGLIPVGIQVVWMAFAYRQLGSLPETMRNAAEASREAGQAAAMQPGMIAQDLLGWLVVLIVVLIGMAKSQRMPNKYGVGPLKL